jgi:hypothetical protein
MSTMSTEAEAEVEAEAAYVDVEARSKAAAEAQAETKAQGEAQSAVLTTRGIQCQKAHELIDLWFYGVWDAEQFKRWLVLTAADGEALPPGETPDPPTLAKLVVVIGLLLGGMAPPTPPAAREAD